MKARNHRIACRDLAQLERLEAEYRWLGQNIEVNRERLTILLLTRPRESARDAAAHRETEDAASEAYYLKHYDLDPPL